MSIIVLKDGLAALKVHLNWENKYVDNIRLDEGF